MLATFAYSLAPCVAFTLVLSLIALMLKTGFLAGILDHPNHRSLHTRPVPRTGGLAIMTGVWAGWIIAGVAPAAFFWCSIGLVVLSCLDDVYGLKVIWRFAGHFIAAIGIVWLSMPAGSAPWTIAVAVIAIVWMTNLFNFMDGSDGLAGGMAFFGFALYAIAAWLSGDTAFAMVNVCLSAAVLGFLVYNFHPARIFMGDAGSIPLGFLAAVLGLIGWQRQYWPFWFPVLVFSPFIVDASLTLAKRALRREKIWQAHREHYYQRLVQSGTGHRFTALLEYVLMLGCGISALAILHAGNSVQAIVLAGWVFIYVVLAMVVDRRWRRFNRSVHAV